MQAIRMSRRFSALVVVAACGRAAPMLAPTRPATPPVAHAQAARPAAAPDRHAELAASIDALAAEALASSPVAGLSIAVSWRGDAVVAKGYGLADVDRKTPVTADTVFRIGSITKQLTAAAILQLAAARKLALDDDLARYLPDYPTHGKRITLRNLLTHTSGIRDYEHGLPWFREHMAEQRPGAELVAQFGALPLDFAPGTRWAYSNSGYYLLGLVIERVARQPYADYLRDHVIAPARLDGIRYCPDDQDYPRAARGYDVAQAARVPTRPLRMVYAYAAGGLCATAPALVAWSRALADERVVDAPSWREMTTPVTLGDGSHFGYGLGLIVSELAGHRVILHGGGINGFVSTLAYYPDDDLHIAVLVNTDGKLADDLGEAIARRVLGVPRATQPDLPISAGEVAALVGRYQATGVAIILVIESEGGKLYARKEGSTARHRLTSQGGGHYAMTDVDARLVFELSGGRVTRFRLTQSGITVDGQRIP